MLNDAGRYQVRAIDNNMGSLPIERITYRVKFLEFGQGIFYMQQRTIPVMPRPLVQQPRRDIQIDNPSRFIQAAPILRIDNDAAPSRQNEVYAPRQIMDSLCFATPKAILTFYFKDGGNRDPGPFDDFVIGIQKWPAQTLGQHPPDSRLASPHQANQINISMLFHAGILAES